VVPPLPNLFQQSDKLQRTVSLFWKACLEISDFLERTPAIDCQSVAYEGWRTPTGRDTFITAPAPGGAMRFTVHAWA